MAHDAYYQIKRVSELYGLLQDDISRNIFWARLKQDIAPSITGMIQLFGAMNELSYEEFGQKFKWKEEFRRILSEGKQIFLYGAGGVGETIAKGILADGYNFSGFIDRNYEAFMQEGLLGKPVYAQRYLSEHRDTSYICLAVLGKHADEVLEELKKIDFPDDHILQYFGGISLSSRVYFDFPASEFFEYGTAFVDGGCFDGTDCMNFAKWCGGNYSKIFAIEPDPGNFKRCEENLSRVKNVRLLEVALGKERSQMEFLARSGQNSMFSHMQEFNAVMNHNPEQENMMMVEIAPLDEVVRETKVGYIKMDLEGCEWDALSGAKNTIVRDRPFLAICVYHIPGDVLAILDYLHQLVPEYRFWLRHYTSASSETILYASVK